MSWLLYRAGFWVRETGQALDRLGCRLQGSNAFNEECKPAQPAFAWVQLTLHTKSASHCSQQTPNRNELVHAKA